MFTEEQIAEDNKRHAEAIAAAVRAKFEELGMDDMTGEWRETAIEAVEYEAGGFMDANSVDGLVTAEMAVAAVIPTFLIKSPINDERTEKLALQIGKAVIEAAALRFR